MWLTVFWGLLALVLAPVFKILYSWYKAKQNLKFYEKQGLKTFFFPVYSAFGLEDRSMPGNEAVSSFQYVLNIVNQNPDLPGMAVNAMGSSDSMVILYKPEYVREYLMKEDDLLKMPLERSFSDRSSFFYYNGDRAMAARTIFNKIFNYENISTFTPEICKAINAHFEQAIKEFQINSESFTKIDLEPLFDPIFEKILNILVFGNAKMSPTCTGRTMYQMIYDFFNLIPKLRRNPLYAMMPTLTLKYELIEDIRKANKINSIMKEHLKEIYAKHEKEGAVGECVLDKIIQSNQQCEKNKQMDDYLNDQELVGMVNVTVFAGTDTSQNESKQCICRMADRKDLQELFDEINADLYDDQGITTAEKIDNNQSLNLWIKEANRICSPIGRASPRYVNRDITLNGLKIRKGDRLIIHITALNMMEKVFSDANTFRLDRFTTENEKKIPKYQQVPFFFGRRICPGRHLGELMVKLVVSQFCRHFEFKKPEGMEYYLKAVIVNRIERPEVEVRLKKKPTQAT